MKDTLSADPLFIDLSLSKLNEDPRNLSLEERGQCSVLALESVPKEMNAKFAVLTCPIDKHNAHKAGFQFSGQTEFFENLWNEKGIMILAGPQLRVGLTTNHMALKDVPAVLDSNLVSVKICLMAESLKKVFGIDRPRIAVCGLNPHCSDGGLFGDEEQNIILPAILGSKLKAAYASIQGPIPADTAFYRAYKGEFDGVLAQYHDQGLGPLKLVHWDTAVNVTGGLRYLRVSPDHGPAADLFGKNQASIKSFAAALELCKNWLKFN
ncbi:MAG: 4-hydroxythreonine-4-phosphate dehydrogenase PdxA [Proteobacteria bacterium]|nr:4-hydroxythreonine-4-phosphate dehydrogenase PdxA [Pseudomonadota bacterium]